METSNETQAHQAINHHARPAEHASRFVYCIPGCDRTCDVRQQCSNIIRHAYVVGNRVNVWRTVDSNQREGYQIKFQLCKCLCSHSGGPRRRKPLAKSTSTDGPYVGGQ